MGLEQLATAMATMSTEQREEMIAQLPEAQRRQMQAAQVAMMDMSHLSEQLKPSPEDPDAPLSTFTVVKALATCPSLKQIDAVTPGDTKIIVETVDKIETALRSAGALTADEMATCLELPRDHRRNVMLIYWQMYQTKLDKEIELDNITSGQQQIANRMCTGILVKAQMLLVQNRWVQATLAIARISALISCGLWSHTEEECKIQMAKVLENDGLPMPELRVEASASAKERPEKEILVDAAVKVDVVLYRDHVSAPGDKAKIADNPLNPQGILEAYWCYAEGVKPDPKVPNSLIGAHPMVVKSLDEPFVSAEIAFRAPPTPGTYPVRVHIISTSVIGVDLTTDTTFTVVEDDLPPLQ